MQIGKKELQEALEIVKPGLANKELIEQSTSFAFVGGKVVTYNDEISISHPIKGLDIMGATKADILYAFLGKVKKEIIDVEIKKNEILLTSGKARAGFTLQEEIKLPLDEEVVERGKWKDIPDNFLRLISFAVSSCGKELAKAILMCVHVDQNGLIEASDDRRITRCDLRVSMPVKTFLIPATSVLEMLRIEPTKIAEGKGWIHFQNPAHTIISCRLFEDIYPSTSHFLRMTGTRVILPHSAQDVLDRAGVFAKREHLLDEIVHINIQDRKLTISAEADSGWFEEETNIKYEGDPISFRITPYLLRGILAETQSCEISKSKIKFEGEGWLYISMLDQNKE